MAAKATALDFTAAEATAMDSTVAHVMVADTKSSIIFLSLHTIFNMHMYFKLK